MPKVVTVRMDEKGRLTLPRSIREALHAKPGDVFYLQPEADGVRIVKGENPFDALAEHAIREYKAGKTRDLRDIARSWGIDLESPDEQS
ncbi:AbrB/MazE/SpoVT family DNA-binding domain-containing protein [Kyrpidia tusciae]|uniref:Transcriptional regulator, AbrB family n=1 Tax=Kyrpidia tusciae (strain DSM 2912 / NBRC 15312 / T2) TaxID=562970 RepID=D5WX20_KYRT2|nr:AbrB/MazE/SpoVT family DNA-binding domain-containing protein [Kyrpidia tusciae]ADG07801.1 transcriptional regulator, AbrB family [Kyrpidia tusciae DSM 2912]